MRALPDRRRVLVVQPRVPTYRIAMFLHLEEVLREQGLDLVLATPPIEEDQRLRGDEASNRLPGLLTLQSRSWSIAGREATYRRTLGLVAGSRIAVLEQTGSNLDLYANLLRAAGSGRPPIALWGHGYASMTVRNGLEERLVGLALRLSDHFFAYTNGGAAYAHDKGVPANRTTVLRNSIDTQALSAAVAAAASAASTNQSPPRAAVGNTALFIGALDPSKRLEFLIAAADKVKARIPDFSLVVGGDGPQRDWLLERAGTRPWIRYVGRMDDRTKAEWAARSAYIVMPGGVGLVAVDSFVLGKPIVTTGCRFHGVEFEYLQDGVDSVVAPDDLDAYAEAMCDLLCDRPRLERLSKAAFDKATEYGAEAMARRFAGGLLTTLRLGKRCHPGVLRRKALSATVSA